MGRVIDEDELIKGRVENDPVVIAAKCTTTAYDPDKVVAQLEEYREEMEQFKCGGMLSDMIEVVKAGGVDAKTDS